LDAAISISPNPFPFASFSCADMPPELVTSDWWT
jgi:hypothetical protein